MLLRAAAEGATPDVVPQLFDQFGVLLLDLLRKLLSAGRHSQNIPLLLHWNSCSLWLLPRGHSGWKAPSLVLRAGGRLLFKHWLWEEESCCADLTEGLAAGGGLWSEGGKARSILKVAWCHHSKDTGGENVMMAWSYARATIERKQSSVSHYSIISWYLLLKSVILSQFYVTIVTLSHYPSCYFVIILTFSQSESSSKNMGGSWYVVHLDFITIITK